MDSWAESFFKHLRTMSSALGVFSDWLVDCVASAVVAAVAEGKLVRVI